MPILPNPKKQLWTGIFQGEFLGDISRAKNIDLEKKPGTLLLADRAKIVADSVSLPALFVPTAFVQTYAVGNGGISYWAMTPNGLFRSRTYSGSDSFMPDIISGTPTNTGLYNQDMLSYVDQTGTEHLLVASYFGLYELHIGSSWTSSYKGISLCNCLAKLTNVILIGKPGRGTGPGANMIGTIDVNGNYTPSALSLDENFQVKAIYTGASFAWIMCQDLMYGSGMIYEWDGGSDVPNNQYPVSSIPLMGFVANEVPYFLLADGRIVGYDGYCLKDIAYFPIFEEKLTFQSIVSYTGIGGVISIRGSQVVGNLVYINVPMVSGSKRMTGGTWIFNVKTKNLYPMWSLGQYGSSLLVDSYSESNQDSGVSLYSGSTEFYGQSFTVGSSDVFLNNCTFYLKSVGSPTSDYIYAQIYAHTGAYGSTGVPTGSYLAQSDLVDISLLSSSYKLVTFSFPLSQRITLSANTRYFVVLTFPGGSVSKYLSIGVDGSSPSAAGNAASSPDGSAWTAVSSKDVCFYVTGSYKDNFDFGQAYLLAAGGILYDSYYKNWLIGGAAYTSYSGSLINAIYTISQNDLNGNRGYFETPLIPSSKIEDFWYNLWLRFPSLKTSSSLINAKFKVADSLLNSSFQPIDLSITWIDSTHFQAALPTNVSVGNEVEVLAGDNAGCLFHISSISGGFPSLLTGLISAYNLDGNPTDSVGSNNGTDTGVQYVTGKIGQAAQFSGISTSGLVSYYKLDANSNDSVGSNNGTDTAISYATAGIIGNCATFNGTTSKIVLNSSSTLNPNEITIAGWIYPTALGSLTIIGDGTTIGGCINLEVFLSSGSQGLLVLNKSYVVQIGLSNIGTIPLNQWSHVAMTYNQTTGVCAFYLNGSSLGGGINIQSLSTLSLSIGSNHQIITFRGSIDELAIFSRALSASEISSLYNSGAGRALQYFGSQIIAATSISIAPFSISFWINTLAGAGAYLTMTDGTHYFRMRSNGEGSMIIDDSTAANVIANFSVGVWQHIVFTWDGTNGKTYVQGTFQNTGAIPFASFSTFNQVQVGVLYATYYLRGLIDMLYIWSRALTATEVANLYMSNAGIAYPFSSTITLDEAAPTISTRVALARFDNWVKMTSNNPITSQTLKTQWLTTKDATKASGPYVKFKIELRGILTGIDQLRTDSDTQTDDNL